MMIVTFLLQESAAGVTAASMAHTAAERTGMLKRTVKMLH